MKIVLTVLALIVSFAIHAQKCYLTNQRQITKAGIEFQSPKWSPDGKNILVTREKKNELYLIHLDSLNAVTMLSNENGSGLNYSWGKGNVIKYVVKVNEKFVTRENLSCMKNKPGTTKVVSDTVVEIEKPTLSIIAKLSDGSRQWKVTRCEGAFYNPVISPDKKRVAVNSGADIFVFPISGSTHGVNLGPGLVTGWSPDGKYLLAFLDESKDGHSVSNSDFFIINIENQKKIQLTFSENLIEMWPSFSADGKKIVYVEGKSGQLFIADFNTK
jgi:Tol biopolymer transport system component